MDVIILATFGILSSILVFGIKTGLGCGFADIKKRTIIPFGFVLHEAGPLPHKMPEICMLLFCIPYHPCQRD